MNINLTWQEKFVRLTELDPNMALKVRPKGAAWYVSTQLHVASGGTSDRISASGASAEQAVENFWRIATETIATDAALVIGLDDSKGFRWANYKWQKVNLGALT